MSLLGCCFRQLTMELHIILLLLYWILAPRAVSGSSDFNSERYQSYLQFPRISFGGRFKANVASGNNNLKNFINERFFHYDRFGLFQGGKNLWNSEGTNEFILMDCYVTSACHIDGKCTEETSVDEICGTSIKDSEFSSFAKMAEIDAALQCCAEIWGWKVRVPGFFEGKVEPSPLRFFWRRRTSPGDTGNSAVYQSTIRDVTWEADATSSSVIKQMRERMQHLESNELSITFTLDMFNKKASKDFATGRILGAIGVSGLLAPRVDIFGRSLAPVYPGNEEGEDKIRTRINFPTNYAPFIIDEQTMKLHIFFLNSLHTTVDGIPINFPNRTKIGYFLKTTEVGHFLYPSGNCNESVVVIADISLMNMTNIMLKLGGIVDIDLNEEQMENLSHNPLSIFWSTDDDCSILFMQEYKDGLHVRSYENWMYRLEHGQQISHKLFVTKFGKPGQDVSISITPSDNHFDSAGSTGYHEPRPFTKIFKSTDENGFATFEFPTRSSNYYIRNGIDGNIEGYAYAIVNSSMSILSNNLMDRLIVARVFHNYSYPDEPTWVDHILPIFQQYANLYPVMKNRGFDLSNYFSIVDHKEILRLSLSLPIEHPDYMPVTRDLSQVKKEMILKWLSKDIPPFGDASKLLTKHYLLDLLQTALEVTHATIPPLLTALWSIKKGYNEKIRKTLIKIIDQEKDKIDILARIMLSLGGRPKLFHGSFVLIYPSMLPGDIDKNVKLSLEMLSEDFLRNIMDIKRPETSKISLWFKSAIFTYTDWKSRYLRQLKWNGPKCCKRWSFSRIYKKRYRRCRAAITVMLETSLKNLKPEKTYNQYEDPQERKIFNYHDSVDSFFYHILLVLSFITNCGSNNAIFERFNSTKSWRYCDQNDYDYVSAVNDLRHIMKVTNSIHGESQYNLLRSIVEDKCIPSRIRSCKQSRREVRGASNNILDNYASGYESLRKQSAAPSYSILPIVANMKAMRYPKGKARDLARAFNDVYTFYLISYEKMLNAFRIRSRRKYESRVKELERAFHVMGHRLVQTPLHIQGGKHSGPNMAPTFEVDFEIARTGFLEQKHIIDKLKEVTWNIDRYNQIREQYKPYRAFASRQDRIFQDEAAQQLSDIVGIYQPLNSNPYFDLY